MGMQITLYNYSSTIDTNIYTEAKIAQRSNMQQMSQTQSYHKSITPSSTMRKQLIRAYMYIIKLMLKFIQENRWKLNCSDSTLLPWNSCNIR